MLKKRQTLKKAVISGLTAVMILGGATSAFADDGGEHEGHGKGKAQFHFNGHGNYQVKIQFKDLNKNYDWVMQNIARLAAMGVFQGYDDGTFRPQKQISRIEAIISAVRLMGLKDQAESQAEMNTHLSFKDEGLIERKYPNAVGYVAVALENDLFSENANFVYPDKPATREWATVLLIKALKLQDEAKKMMNTELPFSDADQIDVGSRGYVALAVQKKLVSGYQDNTFRPNRPVTRAELAALLDRTGDQMPQYNDGAIHGTVVGSIQSNVLTLTENGQTQTYAVDPNAFVFRNGVKSSLADVKAGDQITARAYNNVIVFIEVKQAAQEQDAFTATVNAAYQNGMITLSKSNQNVQYSFAGNAVITRNGTTATAADIKVGDVVFVRTTGTAIDVLQVLTPVDDQANITGHLSAVNADAKYVVVTDSSTQASNVYYVDDNALIIRNGVSAALSSLQVGDEVTIRLVNNKAVYIGVTSQQQNTFTATVTTAYNGTNIMLTGTNQNQSTAYTFAGNALIYRNGVAAAAADIKTGDVVFVRTTGSAIDFLQVITPVVEQTTVSGTIAAVNTTDKYVVVTDNGQSKVYYLNDNALIFRKGAVSSLADLKAGDQVTVNLMNNKAIYITVTTAIEDQTQAFTVNGFFKSLTLNSAGQIASISVTQAVYGSTQTSVYNVSPNVTITGNAANLVTDHAVQLSGQNQVVTQIAVQ